MQQSSTILMPFRVWRARLSVRLVSAVLGMSLLGATLLTAWSFRNSAQALEEQISSTGKTLAKVLAQSCENDIITDEIDIIEERARFLLNQPEVLIAFVRIERANGTVLNMDTQPTAEQLAATEARPFSAPVLLLPERLELGRCTIWLADAPWRTKLATQAAAALIGNLLSFSLIATVVTLLLRSWLGRPLARLDEAAQRIATGDLDARVAPTGVGELRRFANTLETMRASLRESHANLAQQNERLRELDRLKDEFIANTSHEIRTPLSSILGGLELLADATPEEREPLLDAMRRNGSHLLFLINQVLDFSKLQSDNLCVELQDVALRPLLEDVVGCLWPKAHEKRLRLELQCDPAVPTRLRTDPLRLRQVLMNLIGNALKFTTAGSVTLAVRALPEASTPRLEFAIVDTGPGIDAETQQRLFVPFAQGDASMSRRFGGTGLGLVISRKLTRLLGGDITLASSVGRGTTVRVELPIVAATTAASAATPAAAAPAEPATPTDVAPLAGRVLLVDDAADNRRLLSTMLRKAGVAVTLAEDGQRGCDTVAAAAAAGQPFDLVLMDIQMPVLDGHAAARILRAAGHDMPLVALTAHATDHDREACLAAGFDDYATKPITRAKLTELVRRFVPSSS